MTTRRAKLGPRAVAAAALLCSSTGSAMADGVILQGLDKITARVSTFEAPIEELVRFGTLEIIARTCYKAPPEENPESAAFLEIIEVRPDEPPAPLFTGWMFASSPALSALEHPVYDVWVIDCKSGGAGHRSQAGRQD